MTRQAVFNGFSRPAIIIPKELNLDKVLDENYAGYDATVECSRQRLQSRWEAKDFDPKWTYCPRISSHSGKVIHGIRSNTDREWNGIELRFSLGLFAVPIAYERAINTVNDLGFNIVIETLGMMNEEDIGIPSFYPDDIHDFQVNRDLEVDRGHDHEDKSIICITHSTSGTGSLKNGSDPNKVRQYINRGIIGALDTVPFCGMAGANWEYYPRYRRALQIQAALTPHLKPSQTFAGRMHSRFMKFVGEPQVFSSIGDPTFAQMVNDMEPLAQSTMQALASMEPDQLKLPRVLIVPHEDSIASTELGLDAGQLMGCHVHRTDAWHNPIVEHPRRSIKRMLKVVEAFTKLEMQKKLAYRRSSQAAADASPLRAPHAA